MRVIYIDILFLYNFLADLILLKIVSLISRRGIRWLRLLLSAALGGMYACFHFFSPLPPIAAGVANIAALIGLCCVAFHFYSLRDGLKLSALTLATGFGMGGGVMALYFLFGDGNRFKLQNGIFYLDFSLLQLLLFAVAAYAVISFSYTLFLKIRAGERTVEATILMEGKSITTLALLDTGCRLRDPITGKRVAVISSDVLENLLGIEEIKEQYPERYRVLSASTVGGDSQLEAFRPDKVILKDGGRTFECDMLVAVSQSIKADYKMVLCCEAVY